MTEALTEAGKRKLNEIYDAAQGLLKAGGERIDKIKMENEFIKGTNEQRLAWFKKYLEGVAEGSKDAALTLYEKAQDPVAFGSEISNSIKETYNYVIERKNKVGWDGLLKENAKDVGQNLQSNAGEYIGWAGGFGAGYLLGEGIFGDGFWAGVGKVGLGVLFAVVGGGIGKALIGSANAKETNLKRMQQADEGKRHENYDLWKSKALGAANELDARQGTEGIDDNTKRTAADAAACIRDKVDANDKNPNAIRDSNTYVYDSNCKAKIEASGISK